MLRVGVVCVALSLCGCPGSDGPQPSSPTPNPNPAGDTPFAAVSRTEIKAAFTALKRAAEAYKSEHRSWPKDVDVLVADEYVRRDMVQDPWGRPYVLEPQGTAIVVRSYGADGQPGGTDADTDWDSESTALGVPGGS